MQDDISKVSTSVEEARQGCEDVYELLTKKQLSVNNTKCKFMILGSKKQRKQALAELESNPMMMGGRKIDHTVNKKYLGDFVSELGCKQSIDDTIKYRIQKLTSKVNDILLIADAPQLGAEGTSMAAIKLFEAQVMSGLLFNCESWIGITEAQIDELQSFQDNFLKKLLHLPVSPPKSILHW